MRPSHVVVRLAIAVGYVLTLSGAAPAWGLDLTGVWFGEQQCDRFDGKKFSTPFKNDIMAITQVGADARMAALCTPVDDSLACGLFYQGTVIDSSKDGDRQGEAGFTECETAPGSSYQETLRAHKLEAKPKGDGQFEGTSIFLQFRDQGPDVGTCEWHYKRVSTQDLGVPTCAELTPTGPTAPASTRTPHRP